ncbi:hypothetical protein [Vibrio sp. Hal054]|uniref:hypothetical protein n=1 Tax=Vibrio sp. Hal054 TaxID=3035158 RepID=UPI00301D7166
MNGSRWVSNFENHAFRQIWNQILAYVDEEPEAFDKTIAADVQEIARLVKAVTYLNELLDGCDPELIPLSTWGNFGTQCQECWNQINTYKSNKNIGHIRNANNNLDNLLSYLRPYMQVKGNQAKSMSASLNAYQKSIDNQLEQYLKKLSELNTEINSIKKEVEESLTITNSAKNRISEYEDELFEGEGNLRDQINSLTQHLESTKEDFDSYKEELLEEHGGENSIEASITKALENAKKDRKSINEDLVEVRKETEFLYDVYKKVHGVEDENGEVTGGLLSEITDRQTKLDVFRDKHEQRYKALNEQIEKLLPGAASAGLASAYHDLKIGCKGPIKTYSLLFYVSMVALISAGFLLLTKELSFSPFTISFMESSTDWVSISKSLIRKLPVIVPIVWFALFVSKRRNEFSRLHEEYAHKEALAKSYQGFKQQIEELSDNDDKLLKELLSEAIKAISFNASTTLDKKHDEGTPAKSLVDSILKLKDMGVLK